MAKHKGSNSNRLKNTPTAADFERFQVGAGEPSASATPRAFLDTEQIPEGIVEVQARLESEMVFPRSVDAGASAFRLTDGRADRSNILGTAIGEKESNGAPTGEWAVALYVREKLPRNQIADGLIPREVDGFKTDVVPVGDIVPHAGYRDFERPARCGSSCAHEGSTAGTIGAVCYRGSRLLVLSNNHVLALTNEASIGDYIVHPGPADGGIHRENIIAELEDFEPINWDDSNEIDAAICHTDPRYVTPSHRSYTMELEPVPEAEWYRLSVIKDGRTTGRTVGRIVRLNASLPVNYGTPFAPVYARFRGQIEIRGTFGTFSRPGDSGSLVVSESGRRPVGLLFAGDGVATWANPIQKVIERFDIHLLNRLD